MVYRALSLAAAIVALAPSALAQVLPVEINQTQTLQLPGSATGVVIGNPAIADVVVHSPRMLLVTGRAFGTTNLIVLGNSGREIFSSEISVRDSNMATLVVTRGSGDNTYSCTPECRPSPRVGDEATYVSTIQAQRSEERKAITESSQ